MSVHLNQDFYSIARVLGSCHHLPGDSNEQLRLKGTQLHSNSMVLSPGRKVTLSEVFWLQNIRLMLVEDVSHARVCSKLLTCVPH